MKTSVIIMLMLVTFIIPAVAAASEDLPTYKPKVFGYVENGERWVDNTDDDYNEELYTTDSYYKYDLIKLGFKQKLSKTSYFSMSYKLNDKDYQNTGDTGLTNDAKTLSGYIRFRLTAPLTFKLEGSYRKVSYDITSSEFKNNDWTSGAVSLIYQNKKDPSTDYFFNSPKQRYLLKMGYKRHIFPSKRDNNANTTTMLFHWDYKHSKKLTVKGKARVFARDYEFTSTGHKDSTRQSYQLGAEYQF